MLAIFEELPSETPPIVKVQFTSGSGGRIVTGFLDVSGKVHEFDDFSRTLFKGAIGTGLNIFM